MACLLGIQNKIQAVWQINMAISQQLIRQQKFIKITKRIENFVTSDKDEKKIMTEADLIQLFMNFWSTFDLSQE